MIRYGTNAREIQIEYRRPISNLNVYIGSRLNKAEYFKLGNKSCHRQSD